MKKLRDVFRLILNKVFKNILEITPSGQILANVKNTCIESSLEKALREIQNTNYNSYNTPVAPLASMPTLSGIQNICGGGGGGGGYQMNLSLDNFKTGTVHKKAVLSTRMYGANGGFVLEVQKYNASNAISGANDPTLYILRNEDVGIQLEKILALEFLQRE